MKNLRRLLVGVVIVALSFAAVTGAGVRIRGGSLGDTERQILLTAVAVAIAGILLLFDLAAVGTKWTLLGVWAALLTLGTGFWAVWLIWGHDPNDEVRNYLYVFAVASASLAQICLLVSVAGRSRLIIALTCLSIVGTGGAVGYYLLGPDHRPEWFLQTAGFIAGLDVLGTLVCLVLAVVARRSKDNPYDEPAFSTPLPDRFGQPMDAEWLKPLADDERGPTMWEEAIGKKRVLTGDDITAPALAEPTVAEPALAAAVTGGSKTAGAAVDSTTHRVWTESWQSDPMGAESQDEPEAAVETEAEVEAVPEPEPDPLVDEDEVVDDEDEVDDELAPDEAGEPVVPPPPAPPAAPTPPAAPVAATSGSAPILPGGTVLLSADVEWRLLESSRRFGMSPDEIVLAALDGINDLDDEDDDSV